MIYNYILLFIAWLAWCFLHSILAMGSCKLFLESQFSISSKTFRLWYNLFALSTLILILVFQFDLDSPLIFIPNTLVKFISSFLITVGLIIMSVCIKRYFRQMSGITKTKPELLTTGLHSLVRHPLYSGTFIFLTGLVILFPSMANFISVSIIVGYTLWGINFEERKLVLIFGKDYTAYQQKVPMIVPWKLREMKSFRF